jgi:hypothetical protein
MTNSWQWVTVIHPKLRNWAHLISSLSSLKWAMKRSVKISLSHFLSNFSFIFTDLSNLGFTISVPRPNEFPTTVHSSYKPSYRNFLHSLPFDLSWPFTLVNTRLWSRSLVNDRFSLASIGGKIGFFCPEWWKMKFLPFLGGHSLT